MEILLMAMLINFLFVRFAFTGGTAKEAETLVKKAATYIEANGKEKGFAEFTDTKGKFTDRDLYIFVVDFNGLTLAHGGNSKLVGKEMSELKDADGKFFIKEFIKLAKTKGSGWVDYKWENPVTKKIEQKSTYIQRQRQEDYFLGCGIYKK